MLMLMALTAATGLPEADERLRRMGALYEEICLRTFPNDKAVEAVMSKQDARELSADEVKMTMRDDPARGWELKGQAATVWIEFPPFHACTVRWNTPPVHDLGPYRTIAERYEGDARGFSSMVPVEQDRGDIHIRLSGDRRTLPDDTVESLLIVEQRIKNETRLAAGETGMVLRLVHQFALPSPRGKVATR